MGGGASSTSRQRGTRYNPAGLRTDEVGEMSDVSSARKCPGNSSDLSLGSTGELSLSCSPPLDPYHQAELDLGTEQLHL